MRSPSEPFAPQQGAPFFKAIPALARVDGRLTLATYGLQLILQKRLRQGHLSKEPDEGY